MTSLSIPATLLLLAGCSTEQPAATEQPVAERSFRLVYQSNVAGEIEPCG